MTIFLFRCKDESSHHASKSECIEAYKNLAELRIYKNQQLWHKKIRPLLADG